MNGELITFDRLRAMIDDDLDGWRIEVLTERIVFRGTILRIDWSEHFPRFIEWTEPQTWNRVEQAWIDKGNDGSIKFPAGFCEYVIGPFHAEGGEIFFADPTHVFVTIFPDTFGTFPTEPRLEEECRALRKEMTRCYSL